MVGNDAVTQKQFYETMNNVTDKIIGKIDGVKTDIADLSRETGEVKKYVDGLEIRVETCEGDIKDLEKSDRKVTAITTAIATTISTTIAAVMDSVRRG